MYSMHKSRKIKDPVEIYMRCEKGDIMSLTSILLFVLILSILGVISSALKKNKVILIISISICLFIIAFVLFLMFVLIPSM